MYVAKVKKHILVMTITNTQEYTHVLYYTRNNTFYIFNKQAVLISIIIKLCKQAVIIILCKHASSSINTLNTHLM